MAIATLVLTGAEFHPHRLVDGQPSALPAARPTTPAPGAANAPSGAQEVLATVRATAATPGILPVYIRASAAAGACPLVRSGDSPRRRISALLHRQEPLFRVTDAGFTLDPFTGMCALQVRARSRDGSVLVAAVVAPERGGPDAGGTKSLIGTVSNGFTETSYAFELTAAGWQVTVGSTGPAGEQPSMLQLQKLAENPVMSW